MLLFLGGFVLASAMVSSGLDRRIAWTILARPWVAASPTRLLVAFALLTGGVSAWMNNTSTTAMFYPIGLGVLGALARHAGRADVTRLRFGTALMLSIAWAASIGGIMTPVGSSPNLIVLGQLQKLAGTRVPFFHWMVVAVPIAVVMLFVMVRYLRWALPPDVPAARDATAEIEADRAAMGPPSRTERNVLFAFGVTVTMWVVPGLLAVALGTDAPLVVTLQRLLPESVAAVLGAVLLFVLPVDWKARRFTLTWAEASQIDWGTLMLFGGGLALGGAMFRTGLAESMGSGLVAWTGSESQIALTCLFCWVAIVLTETTSNTATATMLAPLAIASAQAAGVSPVPSAMARRAGREHGVHAARLDAAERDRLRLGLRADHGDGAPRRDARPRERRDRAGGRARRLLAVGDGVDGAPHGRALPRTIAVKTRGPGSTQRSQSTSVKPASAISASMRRVSRQPPATRL